MLQPLILSTLLLVVAFLQPVYPSLENLQPITAQNAASLQQVAAIGSDTLDNVQWSPDGQILAAVTSGSVVLYKVDDLNSAFRTIPHPIDEKVSFTQDGHLVIGSATWDIQKGTLELQWSPVYKSPSGHLEITGTSDNQQTVVSITDTSRSKPTQLLTGSTGKLEQVVFSPDEEYVVIKLDIPRNPDTREAGYEIAQLWNLNTGTKVRTLDQRLETFDQIAFNGDGSLLVTSSIRYNYGGPDEDIGVWDGHTGNQLNSNKDFIHLPARFSPDKALTVFPILGGFSLWSNHHIGTLSYQPANQEAKTYLEFLEKPLFSPDGKTLLALYEHQVIGWDINAAINLDKPSFVLENNRYIHDYFFSTDGSKLFVQNDDLKIRVWDMTQSTPIQIRVLNTILDAQISPDSKWLWGSTEYTDHPFNRVLVDATTGEVLQTLPSDTQLDPQWKYASYWSKDTVTIIDLAQNVPHTLKPLPDYLGKAEYFDAQNGQFAFTSASGIKVFDGATGKAVFSYDNRSDQYELSANGKLLLSIQNADETKVQVDELEKRTLLKLYIQDKNSKFFLLPDEKTLAYTVSNGIYTPNSGQSSYSRYELWDLVSGEIKAKDTVQGEIETLALSPTNDLMVLGIRGSELGMSIGLVDLNHPQSSLKEFDAGVFNFPNFDQLKFTSDGQYLAASIDEHFISDGDSGESYWLKLYDANQIQKQPSTQIEPLLIIQSARFSSFSPNNQYLLVYKPPFNYADKVQTEFELWGLDKQVKLASVTGDSIAAFSPDSALIAIHNEDHTEIYSTTDLAAGSITPLVTLSDKEGRIKNLAFSADGKRLYLVEEARVRVYGVQ